MSINMFENRLWTWWSKLLNKKLNEMKKRLETATIKQVENKLNHHKQQWGSDSRTLRQVEVSPQAQPSPPTPQGLCSTPWGIGPSALLCASSLECPPLTIWGHQRQLGVSSSSSIIHWSQNFWTISGPVRSLERPLWNWNFTSERWQNLNHPMFAIQYGSTLYQHQVQAAQ